MNPHELAALSPEELSTCFRQATGQKNVPLALDIFTQIESRFQEYATSQEGNQRFVDEFLALCGSAELKALHLDDQLQQCVTRLEYLLELAGERASMQSNEEMLHQIVESRERGRELIEVLGQAKIQGMIASELADRLGISQANLSPLIRLFSIEGVIDRRQIGKNAFLKLTPQGRAVLKRIEPATYKSSMLSASQSKPAEGWVPDQPQALVGELILKVAYDVHASPWSGSGNVPHVVQHTLDQLEAQYDEKVAAWIRGITDRIRSAISMRVA